METSLYTGESSWAWTGSPDRPRAPTPPSAAEAPHGSEVIATIRPAGEFGPKGATGQRNFTRHNPHAVLGDNREHPEETIIRGTPPVVVARPTA